MAQRDLGLIALNYKGGVDEGRITRLIPTIGVDFTTGQISLEDLEQAALRLQSSTHLPGSNVCLPHKSVALPSE